MPHHLRCATNKFLENESKTNKTETSQTNTSNSREPDTNIFVHQANTVNQTQYVQELKKESFGSKKGSIHNGPLSFPVIHKVVLATALLSIFLTLVFYLGWRRRTSSEKKNQVPPSSCEKNKHTGRLGIAAPNYSKSTKNAMILKNMPSTPNRDVSSHVYEGCHSVSDMSSATTNEVNLSPISNLSCRSDHSNSSVSSLSSYCSSITKSRWGDLGKIDEENEETIEQMMGKLSSNNSLIGSMTNKIISKKEVQHWEGKEEIREEEREPNSDLLQISGTTKGERK